METVYLICAAIGGTILVLQTILLIIAGDFGGDASDAHVGHLDGDAAGHVDHDPVTDSDAAHDAHLSFIKLLSFKTVVAFMTFFGLTGLAGRHGGLDAGVTLVLAAAAGLASVYLVGWLMAALGKLQSRGNLDLHNAIGGRGVVYLRIPGEHKGTGRVTLAVQGRKIECRAVTEGPELETGADVRVTALTAQDTLEVARAEG